MRTVRKRVAGSPVVRLLPKIFAPGLDAAHGGFVETGSAEIEISQRTIPMFRGGVVVRVSQMLSLPLDGLPSHAALFAEILRALRRRRGLTASEVARRMRMAKRTYELFESGTGKLSLRRLQQFADATDTDAYAILASLAFGDPGFALRCADNKLMTAVVESVRDLNSDVGDDLSLLDARVAMQAFDAAARTLGDEAAARRRRRRSNEDESPME